MAPLSVLFPNFASNRPYPGGLSAPMLSARPAVLARSRQRVT